LFSPERRVLCPPCSTGSRATQVISHSLALHVGHHFPVVAFIVALMACACLPHASNLRYQTHSTHSKHLTKPCSSQ
jgi:hypothetical protein